MKITITTDNGEVVDIIEDADVGDLRIPFAKADLIGRLKVAVSNAREKEAEERRKQWASSSVE